MWKLLKLVVLIAVLFRSKQDKCCLASKIYTVSSQCNKGNHSCHELSFYIQDASRYFINISNVEFKFLSGTHILNSTLVPMSISGIEGNITFTGQSTNDTPIIQCTDGSHGFAFQNVFNITLRSLIIEGCSPTIHDSALTVNNSNSLTLSDFTIRNTKGVGLMIYDVSTLDIVHSNFSNNGLGISNCSPVTYQWWHSVNVIANGIVEVHYTIIDTVFNGNTGGQLGGGLHFHIINTQSAVITLKNSMFRGINGCLSAGANITVEGYNLANITVEGLIFFNNYRTDIADNQTHKELKGGALKILTQQMDMPLHSAEYFSRSSSSVHVAIKNSSFVNNKARFCAGAGVITLHSANNYVQVINCTFEGNEMLLSTGSDPCSGRVGGICIISGNVYDNITSTQLMVDIADSEFVNNIGRDGAALQIWPVLYNSTVDYSVAVTNSIFHSNNASPVESCVDRSTIEFRWDYDNTTKGNISIIIDNCNVTDNVYGHALIVDVPDMYAITHHLINVYFEIIRCVFQANSMALGIFKGPGMLYNILIQSSSFSEHKNKSSTIINATIAIIGFSQSTIVNITDIHMFNNTMTPIYADDGGLMFSGHNVIENNIAFQGGGIHISGFGYAFMSQKASLIFKNNKAIRGGALYSPRTQLSKSVYTSCTFLSLRMAHFYNNKAFIAGNNMYGSVLSGCTYYDNKTYQTDFLRISLQDNYVNCSDLSSPNNSEPLLALSSAVDVSSDPFSVLLCDDSQNALVNKSNIIYSYPFYPGQYIHLNITTVGYCNGFSPGFLNVSAQGAEISEDNIQGQKIDQACQPFSFKPLLTQSNINVTVEIDVAHSTLAQTFPFKVFINVLSCPHGMFLDYNETKTCQCETAIKNYVQCKISKAPNPFIKRANSNNWIAYNENKTCIIIAPICPFDYCSLSTDIYFNLNDTTDNQCSKSSNRRGTLCGQCQPKLSLMLGSNRCGHCSNYYLLLLIVFFIAGLLLILLIIVLNLTISMGMLNGLLFYANIVKLNETQLFPNGNIPVISQFISWLNLDFGIESCFINGLDGYWKTWLQFAFPLYVWLVTIGIILISKYSIKFSQYLPTNIISVLATLILISFTKLLHTVTAVFMATSLECKGTHAKLVWSVDGSIAYWSTKHLILMGFAVIIIMFIAVYTFLLLFYKCLQRATNYEICCFLRPIMFWIHPFIDAYSGPFVPRYGYWTGVLVLIRIIMTVVFVYTSGSAGYINNYVIVTVEFIIFNVFHSGFYQSKLNYYCEKFFHINLCAICLVNALEYIGINKADSPYVAMATITSVALSLLVFIAIIGWHGYKVLHKRCIKRIRQPLLDNEEDDEDKNINAGENYGTYSSASSTVRQRDAIIFDSD